MGNESPYRFTRVAEDYDDDRFSGPFGKWLEKNEVDLYLRLTANGGKKILDVGAGTGKLTIPFLAQGFEVVSLDRHGSMLDVAKRKIESIGFKGHFVEGDAQSLNFPDRSFDVVVSSRVFMHLPRWKKAIGEWCRVSRSVVIFDYPRLASFALLDTWIKKIKKLVGKEAYPYHVHLSCQVKKQLRENGFQIIESSNAFFLPIVFYRFMEMPRLAILLENFLKKIGLTALFGSPQTIKAQRILEDSK